MPYLRTEWGYSFLGNPNDVTKVGSDVIAREIVHNYNARAEENGWPDRVKVRQRSISDWGEDE